MTQDCQGIVWGIIVGTIVVLVLAAALITFIVIASKYIRKLNEERILLIGEIERLKAGM